MEEESDKSYEREIEDWRCDNSERLCQENSQRAQQAPNGIDRDLSQLHRSKERFKQFLKELKELKKSSIRQDILHYYGGQKKAERTLQSFYRPEALLKKIEVRIDKMLKTKKLKRNWGEEDLKILIWVISKYCDLQGYTDLEKQLTSQDWRAIASVIPGVTSEACMFKWLSIKKVTLATHNWTKQESEKLAQIVSTRLEGGVSQEDIKDWKIISQDLYQLNDDPGKVYRNAKQCRQHWTCYLSPQLKKGPWQLYQDVKLLKFIKDNKGLKKWSEIARHFEGRTENALKNRYTLIIDKQKKHLRNKGKSELDLISEYLQKCYIEQYTAHVKVEEDSIYQEDSHSSPSPPPSSPSPKRQDHETHAPIITPTRVERVRLNDLEAMNVHFFRNMQPGVMSDGIFKKIYNFIRPLEELEHSQL